MKNKINIINLNDFEEINYQEASDKNYHLYINFKGSKVGWYRLKENKYKKYMKNYYENRIRQLQNNIEELKKKINKK
jgi:hypothetical protein